MLGSLEALFSVVSPPENPMRPDSPIDWAGVEEALGTPLPSDYKEFVHTYGVGGFHYGSFTFLYPYVPFAGPLDFAVWAERVLAGYRQLHSEWPEIFPIPAYSEPGGLLPWGRTDNGQDLYWVTQGQPDEWTVAVVDHDVETFSLPMTGFLAGWISGTLQPRFLPDLPLESIVFRPLE